MKIIGRASAVNLELDAGGIVNVFTTAAIAVPFDQANVEIVDNDGHHRYLIELAEVTSYTPDGGVETAFSGTRDQLIDILNDQFFTGGNGGSGSGFSPTTEVLQSQLVRFSADTVVDAQALTFVEGERVHIRELDEEFCAKNITVQAPTDLSGGMITVADKIYAVTMTDGTYGHGTIISFDENVNNFRTEYIFNGTVDDVIKPTGTIAFNNNSLYIFFLEGGANSVGGIGKFDVVTKTFTKITDLSTTTGYDTFDQNAFKEAADPIIYNNAVYESLSEGGANNHGTIVKLDFATETLTVVNDYTSSNLLYTKSVASGVYDNFLYLARNNEFFRIDTSDVVTIVGTFGNNAILSGNIVKVNDSLFAPYYQNNQFIALECDLLTGNCALYRGPSPSNDNSVNVIGVYNIFPYGSDFIIIGGGNVLGGVNNEIIIATNDLQGGAFNVLVRVQDDDDQQPKGLLVNYTGNVLTWLDKGDTVRKYDLSTSTLTSLYNLSQIVATVDNVNVIDIGQAPMYLQVLDDHLKSINTVNGLATITSARGVESTFNYSSGFIDYNDSSAAIPLAANTWTDIPNNGAGAFSNDAYKPNGVNDILDTATGYLDFSELEQGDEVFLRIDFNVIPNLNNAFLECRMELGTGAGTYQLNVFSKRLDNGAGVSYPSEKGAFYVYMGDTNTLNNPGKLQVRLSSGGSLDNAGVAISIIKK